MKSRAQLKIEVRRFMAWRRRKLAEQEMRDLVDELCAEPKQDYRDVDRAQIYQGLAVWKSRKRATGFVDR